MNQGSFLGVVANALDFDIIVSKFKPQLSYYLHLQTNTLGESMNPLITQAIS